MDVYFGGLLEFDENENIELSMNEIDYEQAIKIIETAITYAVKSGVYNLSESYVLYKCLSKTKEKKDLLCDFFLEVNKEKHKHNQSNQRPYGQDNFNNAVD